MKIQNPDQSAMLVDEREAARLLGISPRAMWSLAESGEIPVVRINRSKRYDPADLRAYVESHKIGGEGR